VALVYDRVFWSVSIREALRRRRALYLGLAATWALLAALLALAPSGAERTAGFDLSGLRPWTYAASQPVVLLHYLRLTIWPAPLVLDYGWPAARALRDFLPSAVVVGILLLSTLWALRRAPGAGFLGAWFFLLLAPSSSVIPIADLAVEHRMYLPLIAPMLFAVVGGWTALTRLVRSSQLRTVLGAVAVLLVVAGFGRMTIARNAQYQDEIGLWRDTVANRPHNARAQANLATALSRVGRGDEALALYQQALRMDPALPLAHLQVGQLLGQRGEWEAALPYLIEAAARQPRSAACRNNLGAALAHLGRLDEAMGHYEEAIRLDPFLTQARMNLEEAHAASAAGMTGSGTSPAR
jgi:tetratricopeptide (TPR) repeat protein